MLNPLEPKSISYSGNEYASIENLLLDVMTAHAYTVDFLRLTPMGSRSWVLSFLPKVSTEYLLSAIDAISKYLTNLDREQASKHWSRYAIDPKECEKALKKKLKEISCPN